MSITPYNTHVHFRQVWLRRLPAAAVCAVCSTAAPMLRVSDASAPPGRVCGARVELAVARSHVLDSARYTVRVYRKTKTLLCATRPSARLFLVSASETEQRIKPPADTHATDTPSLYVLARILLYQYCRLAPSIGTVPRKSERRANPGCAPVCC